MYTEYNVYLFFSYSIIIGIIIVITQFIYIHIIGFILWVIDYQIDYEVWLSNYIWFLIFKKIENFKRRTYSLFSHRRTKIRFALYYTGLELSLESGSWIFSTLSSGASSGATIPLWNRREILRHKFWIRNTFQIIFYYYISKSM